MAALRERPRIEFYGIKRRGARAGVLVLQGASPAEFDRARRLAGTMAEHRLLVAVDGGLQTCLARRRRPDLHVGDGDSSPAIPAGLHSIVYPQDKDFSDLAGALGEMRRREVHIVCVAGLLGGRLDHEWANLFELGARARHFTGIVAASDRGTVVVTSRGCRATTSRRRTFSLFSLSATSTVTLRGTRWELDRRRIRPGSIGLSNVTESGLDLLVHSGSAGLVFPSPFRIGRRG